MTDQQPEETAAAAPRPYQSRVFLPGRQSRDWANDRDASEAPGASRQQQGGEGPTVRVPEGLAPDRPASARSRDGS